MVNLRPQDLGLREGIPHLFGDTYKALLKISTSSLKDTILTKPDDHATAIRGVVNFASEIIEVPSG